MFVDNRVYMGLDGDGNRVYLDLSMANRHGLIAGATGTGKTIFSVTSREMFPEFVNRVSKTREWKKE